MSKLYPPYIEGTIPAFCDTKEGTVLTVPFSMNRAVSKREVAGFYLKMKTIQSDKYLITLKSNNFNIEKQEVYFDLSNVKDKLKIGQFYKVQIAYVESDKSSTIGYYSSVGIVKYTSRPSIYIEGLNKNFPNKHTYTYLGCYSQEKIDENDNKDYTEKVYSYRFVIFDKNNNYLFDTDWLLHNNSTDVNNYESQDKCAYVVDLEDNTTYYIQYHVITNNGLQVSSSKYRLTSTKSIAPDVKTQPILELNFDNGYVGVKLDSKNYTHIIDNELIETPVSGSFVLSRKTKDSAWEEVYRFALINEKLSEWYWEDFTVEQGKIYAYAIQEYNDYELYSEKIYSDEIYVDFEDAFLFDGERQLKIRYNPKISSFKTNHLENKIDTIGSKHPFIFRNGNVEYKEFPISGLISYQMDEENLFNNKENRFSTKFNGLNRIGTFDKVFNSKYYENLGFDYQKIFQLQQKFDKVKELEHFLIDDKKITTDLVGYNISAERDFKLEVLDWLNNGKPKLFRSPNEGNYIVRLLNTSLSPEDGLGRMLHTFNSTAYEIAKYDYENLNKYGFIKISEPDTTQLRWLTTKLLERSSSYIKNKETAERIELMQHPQATSVYFYDMLPGEMVYINGRSIIIGATGTYFIDNGEIITSIEIPGGIIYSGSMTYSYEDNSKNTFDTIAKVEIKDVVAHQFIGQYDNILNVIEDLKYKVSNFYYLDFNKRDTIKVYAHWLGEAYEKDSNGQIVLYDDKDCTSKMSDIPIRQNALIAKMEQNYQNQIKTINSYYKMDDPKMREMARNALVEEINNEYYYKLCAPYLIQYENGDITEEEYEQFTTEIWNNNYDTIMALRQQIDNSKIDFYISESKAAALEKAKEKYLLQQSMFKTKNSFEKNPFVIYQYDLSQCTLETTHGDMVTIGFVEVDLSEEDFLLTENDLRDRYYIKNSNGDYENIFIYDETQQYYMKKSYEFYFDPQQPMTPIVSEDTIKRIGIFENDKKNSDLNNAKDFKIQNKFYPFVCKAWINENEIDLSDSIDFKIKSLSLFDKIELSCGVMLNCGYEIQILEYFDEQEMANYELINNLRALLYTSQKNIDEIFFDELLIKTGLNDSVYKFMNDYYYQTGIKLNYSQTKKRFFDDIIFEAQTKYDFYYEIYLRQLAAILKEKGVIE